MNALGFWLLGWILLSIGYFIYNVYIAKDMSVNKKVHAWRAFWTGIFSWIGIIFVIAFVVVGYFAIFMDWVEEKLNSM